MSADPYVPGHGDPRYAVDHYDLDLTYKPAGNHLDGRAVLQVTTLEAEGVRVESVQEVATKILPYLTVVQGADVSSRSRTVSYENNYSNLFSVVSRSPMAIEHFQSNLGNSIK